MNYNFESASPRYNVGSRKWDELKHFFPDKNDDIIPFSVADMEFEIAPEIREGLKKYIDTYALGYANPTDPYKQAVCKWEKTRHDWDIKPEWILDTPGIVNAFHNAVQAFTKPDEGVMLMTPCYYPMYNAVTANGRKLVENPVILKGDHYEIDFDDFETKAKDKNTKMLILCNPHNPTSRVFMRQELERIGRICIDNGVFICADEIHNDLIIPGYHHTVFASVSEELADHSMVCVSASKTFNLAGLQTSAVVIKDEKLRATFLNHQKKLEINPKCNILGYEATRLAYEYGAQWCDECLKIIDHNYKLIKNYFVKELPSIKTINLEGTYLLWMDFRALNIGYEKLAEVLRTEAQLFFDDGYIFGKLGEGFERWNLACPSKYIEAALPRLKKAMQPYL